MRGGVDKSLARTGRKEATANNLGNYSTYSPQSSKHFIPHCSNFWKPLKKNSQKKAFFIFKEEFLPALCNEMHVAAISRNLVKAFHCLNNESQKVIYSIVGQ